jgi:hypothetical protein
LTSLTFSFGPTSARLPRGQHPVFPVDLAHALC